jgi:shikimate dehydrogenase
VSAVRTLGFKGFNVTIPHKASVIELLDELDGEAERIGAVNTVVNDHHEKLVGYNTDGKGAYRAVQSYGYDPENKRILVIGAGGSARAIIHELAKHRNDIQILNRTVDNAKKIVENLKNVAANVTFDQLNRLNLETSIQQSDLVVNTTPLQTTQMLQEHDLPVTVLKNVDWLFDIAYNTPLDPVPTKHGRISPYEMLLQQAALSYEIWTHTPAPIGIMRSTLSSHLERDLT